MCVRARSLFLEKWRPVRVRSLMFVSIFILERDIYTSIRGVYGHICTCCNNVRCIYSKKKKRNNRKRSICICAAATAAIVFVGEYKKETRKNVWNEVKCLRASIKFKAQPPRWRTIPSSLDPSYARLSTFRLKWFRLQLQSGNKIENVLTYLGETLGDPFFLLSTIIPIERVELIRGQYSPVVWHTLRSFWIDPARASYEREIE